MSRRFPGIDDSFRARGLLRIGEAARELGVPKEFLQRQISGGHIQCVEFEYRGKMWRGLNVELVRDLTSAAPDA
jgi:hypothetical protein